MNTKTIAFICLSAFAIALLSITLALCSTNYTTNSLSIKTSAIFDLTFLQTVLNQNGLKGLLDLLGRGHHHHHHHHHHHLRRKPRVTCDDSKWKSSLISDYSVSRVFTVGLNQCANFSSVQKAVDAVPDLSLTRTLIIIDSGTYRSIFFGEYGCLGPGANYTFRVSYGKQLKQTEAKPFLDVSYIDGNNWLPNISLDTFGDHSPEEFIQTQ